MFNLPFYISEDSSLIFNMPASKRKVIEVVKDYVHNVGGIAPLEFLLQDYKTAYHDPLPFAPFGYSTVEDFLCDIEGISLDQDEDGTLYVQYTGTGQLDDSRASEMDDFTLLSVQMKNTLLLDSHRSSRIVTIQSRDASSRSNSEEISWHAASGRPSPRSSSGPLTESGYYSTYDSPEDNQSSSCGASYSSFENLQYPTAQSWSKTHDFLSFQGDAYNPFYRTISSEPCLSGESNYLPGPMATNSSEPYGKQYSSGVHQMADTFRATYDSDNTLDTYPRNTLTSSKTLVPSSGSTYDPNLYQSYPPRDISVTDTLLPSLPVLNNMPTLGVKSVLPTALAPNTLPTLRPFPPRLAEEAHLPSQRNNWSGKLRQFTEDDLIGRILNVVNLQKQFGGIDSSTIERKYREMYETPLPEQWLALLEERGALYVEKLTRETIVYPNRFFPMPPTVSSLPPLRYPNIDRLWNVHVSQCVSISRVWFRLKDEDFDRKYEILHREMNRHYPNEHNSIKCLIEVSAGQLCAVKFRNEWFRGEVLENDPKAGWVKCLLFDEGITQNFPSDEVYPLHERFTNTPSLTLKGRLHSLEKWETCNYINCEVRRHFHSKPDVTVKIHKFLSPNEVTMLVNIEIDSQKVDLNAWMTQFASVQLSRPILYTGRAYEIIISSIGGNETAQVQIKSTSLEVLADTLEKVSDAMKDRTNRERARVKSIKDMKLKDTIYLAHCADGSWKRIRCLQVSTSKTVSAMFVDLGEEKSVHLRDIFDTSVVSDIICFIDSQAVPVQLTEVDAVYLHSLGLARIKFSSEILFAMEILQCGTVPFVKIFGKLRSSDKYVPLKDLFGILKKNMDGPHFPAPAYQWEL